MSIGVSGDDHLLILIIWAVTILILILLKSLHPFKSDVLRGEELVVFLVLRMAVVIVAAVAVCRGRVVLAALIDHVIYFQLFQIYLFAVMFIHFLFLSFTGLNLLMLLVVRSCASSLSAVVVSLL